ncbi:acetolactate synthase-1/2/3 large subunit [Anaerosolibacter carboniphilus]|uniref:Acetolactate synthase n=2 Tax=Anaerosolibacter carboniphilus TaxID=1417629 RepID=A0A841KXV8_9FIRM|nr:acetolactate synthase-1/2/3 large subunit [Anaerosolibacter carboniphilus]
MRLNGAQTLIKLLEDQGVEVIFGYPGGTVLEIYDALLNSSIKHILVRHEQGAAHAASGYARATGGVGVCLATSGPGATNLVTGIATAYMDSIPIVFFTGQVPQAMVGTDAFQEVDITGITHPITKHNYLVQDIKDLPRIVAEAFYISKTGRPGPVLIDIPRNVSMDITEFKHCPSVDIRGYKPTTKGHPAMIKKAVHAIQESKNLVICTGGGVIHGNASDEVEQIAHMTKGKVVSTLMGLGSYPARSKEFFGMLGTYGSQSANEAVQQCDCLLALGMRFDDRVVGNPDKFAPNATIIHIDIDPAEIGKNIRADIPIVGDIKNILVDMLKLLDKNLISNKSIATISPEKMSVPLKTGLNVPWILSQLSKMAPEDILITTDVGQHQMWTATHYAFNKPRSFISSGGLGTMGYGIPAALGVQIAKPDHLVVAITGDGSFQMGMTEIGAIAELGLPIKILIFNNQTLGMVRQLQHYYSGQRYTGVHFENKIDFVMLAKAFGAEGYRIDDPLEASKIMEKALHNGKFTIIECPIDAENLVLPIVLAGKGLEEMTKNI